MVGVCLEKVSTLFSLPSFLSFFPDPTLTSLPSPPFPRGRGEGRREGEGKGGGRERGREDGGRGEGRREGEGKGGWRERGRGREVGRRNCKGRAEEEITVTHLSYSQVISDLQSQRSRHDLLSILYESELRKHRDTHRLLSTAEKQLTQLKEEGDKRSVAMQIPTLRLIDAPRTSIDSKDKFAHRLCALLGELVSWGNSIRRYEGGGG